MNKRKAGPSDFRFVSHRLLPAGLGLVLVAPTAFLLLSVTAVALVGGSALALFLPFFLRRHPPRTQRDADCIVLDRDQYSRLDDEPRPPRQ
ncbi:MAG: hypothetical protein ACHQ9S_20545 [Candidatus Binatia bacterium]